MNNIAQIQWNNRLKSSVLSSYFLVCIIIFSIILIMQFLLPILIGLHLNGTPLDIAEMMSSTRLRIRYGRIPVKVLFFCIIASVVFLKRAVDNIPESFLADPFDNHVQSELYRTLEEFCIMRGLRTPELYVLPPDMISGKATVGVVQGPLGRAAVIVSSEVFHVPTKQLRALMGIVVYRLAAKDTLFLTLVCFFGHFPFHMRREMGKMRNAILYLPLQVTEALLAPIRRILVDQRLTRIDAGSIELHKDPDALKALMGNMAAEEDIAEEFFDPYVPLFVYAPKDGIRAAHLTPPV